MARNATPALNRPQRPALRVLRPSDGVRDDAERVVMVVTEATAGAMTGIALANEVIATTERIYVAIANRALGVALNEVGKLGYRADRIREELREMVGLIDPKRAA